MPKRKDPPQPIRIELEADTSMPAVLAEVRRHVEESVVLVVPDHCPVLLTVAEFRALKDTAERAGVTVLIESNASLRSQLASMFGIRTVGGERSEHGWRPPDTLLGNTRSYETWVPIEDDDEPKRRRRRQADEQPSRANGNRDNGGSLDYIKDDSPSAIGATARKAGTILAILVVIGLIASIAGWYALPNVTVVATVKNTTVSSEVNYAVAAEGASLPSDIEFTAPAQASEAEVPFEISVPTTGVDRTPQDTASGDVILRNPTAEEITVPQGTTLSIYQGMSYSTDSEITVPPAANNVAGEETVAVTAAEPGSEGNADPGMLTGLVSELGVHYSNRDAAIEGGTDIEVAIVAEEDIQSLQDAVINDYTRAAAAGWTSQLPEGQAVVAPSVATDPIVFEDYTVSAQPGEQAEQISISGTVRATGLIYDQSVVNEETTAYFRESLQSEVPDGYEIDPESVELGEPLALAPAPDNVQFRVSATAKAYAVVNDEALDALRNDMSGSSMDDANARLDQVEQFDTHDLSISPGWWFKRMPQDSARIEIQVVDPAANAADPSPEATAED